MATPQGETLSRAVALRVHTSVASTAAVTAIPLENRQEGMLVQVVGGTLWTYNAASSTAGSGSVLVPDDNPSTGRWLALSVLNADLASSANGKGAALVAIEDAGSFTATTNVEAALAELYQDAESVQKQINIPITSAIDAATGALLAVFADGDTTTPGTELSNSKAVSVRWNNHATPGAIAFTVPMPQDLDDAANVVFHALVSKTGATVGDATKLTIGAYEQTVGALHDADTNFGGDTGAVTGDATAKTVTELTRTLALADIHATPSAITLTIAPKAGTLGTDDLLLHACWLEYKGKLLAS